MKLLYPLLFILLFSGCFFPVLAQQLPIGVQTGPKKGLLNALMNPAEINNLTQPVDVHFLSVQGSFENNAFGIRDLLSTGEFVDLAFGANQHNLNGIVQTSIIGPGVGFKLGKWSVGFSTMLNANSFFHQLDGQLGRYLTETDLSVLPNTIRLNSPQNQRILAHSHLELGFITGYEIFNNNKNKLSIGSTVKLLFPGNFSYFGLNSLQGTLTQRDTELNLSDARGNLSLSFDENRARNALFNPSFNDLGISGLNGIGLDLGINYQLKKNNEAWLNLGIGISNWGEMRTGTDQSFTSFAIGIPEGRNFRLDLLETELSALQNQLMTNEFFQQQVDRSGTVLQLPTALNFNADLQLNNKLMVSAYGTRLLKNADTDFQINSPDIAALIPRLNLGNLEVYNPLLLTQHAGFAAGLGIRFSGFYIGSHSLLTGFFGNRKQADLHFGFSRGFGSY